MENETATSGGNSLGLTGQTQSEVAQAMVLTELQIKALEWLTNGGSITEAAQYAGVSRQAVSRWLRADPDFRAIYEGWREQMMTLTDGQMSALAESAMATLADAVRNRRDVTAAKFVIKHLAGRKGR